MQKTLRLAAAAACAALASLVVLECGVRILAHQELPQQTPEIYRRDTTIGWRRNANIRTLANTGEREVQICMDRRGDRVDCDAPKWRNCSATILVLGDSYVAALAIPFAETVWSRIERDMGACIHVAGVSGYWPQQYALQACERLLRRFESLRGDFDMDLVAHRFVPRLERIPEVDRVVDLLPHFRTHATEGAWGTRDPHFSARGHELWYEALREPIRELIARN